MRKTPGFVSVGAAAIIAGCGGGAPNGASLDRVEPPTSSGSGPMGTASLRLQIPARGSPAARGRRPQWISPSSATLGVRVLASPIPNPTPTENVYTIPSPGPVPTSITVQVPAPISNDTFVASAYDGDHNLLATGSSAPISIALGNPAAVSVTMLGVASGVQFTVAGSTPAVWRVLENLAAPQTTSIDAQPVDADDNLIPGTLAAPASLSTTGGVTLSAASITAATSLTATYPSNTGGSGSIASPLALNAAGSTLNAAVDGDYYVFVDDSDGTVYVIDGLAQKQAGSVLTGPAGVQIAALSGCASGAFAVAGSATSASSFFVPPPTTANPTPAPVATPLPSAIFAANPFEYGAAADAHCNAFYNNSNSGYPVVKLSGFDSTIAANPSFATGFNYSEPLRSISGDLYSAAPQSLTSIAAIYLSETSGGAATTSATYTTPEINPEAPFFVAGAGSSVFLVANTCSGQPVLQSLSGGSLITLSQFEGVAGAAQSTDGMVYIAGLSEASGNAPTLAYGALGSIATAPTIALGATPVDVAVTPDQQYVCVVESPSGSNGQLEFFRRSPSPSLVATVPLSTSSAPTSFSIGP
ncbi:MAG: hypothetical protein ABR949_15035 [Candidatus Aquilonibacter sp.]|jgi:hypothetical protein